MAVRDKRRMKRIMVFMVLFCFWCCFVFLRVVRKNCWESESYISDGVSGLEGISLFMEEMMAFSQMTWTDCPVREAIPPVMAIVVTVSPASSVRTPRSKPRQKAGPSGRISIKPEPQSKPNLSTRNVCLVPRESTMFTSIVCDSINANHTPAG